MFSFMLSSFDAVITDETSRSLPVSLKVLRLSSDGPPSPPLAYMRNGKLA